jgi:adenylate cyclase
VEWAKQALRQIELIAAAVPADPDAAARAATRELAAVSAHSNNTLGVALARLGRLQQAVAHVEQSVAAALSEELFAAACRGYSNLGVLYTSVDPDRAIKVSLQGLALAQKIGDLGFQARIYANLAVAYCTFTGRCEAEGIAAARKAIELDRHLGQRDHLAVPLTVLGQIHQCHGDTSKAIKLYEEALSIAEEMAEPQLLFPCYDGLATISLDIGDERRAEEYFAKAQAVCEQGGIDPDSLMVLPFLN